MQLLSGWSMFLQAACKLTFTGIVRKPVRPGVTLDTLLYIDAQRCLHVSSENNSSSLTLTLPRQQTC